MNNLTQAIQSLRSFHTEHLYNPASKEIPKGAVWENIHSSIDKSQLAAEISRQGGLTTNQISHLTAIFDSYAKVVSRDFGRKFTCSPSALVTVDAFAHKTPDSIFMHTRGDNGKIALTGGGFPDAEELCARAIEREIHEETGEGCTLIDSKKLVVWDLRRGGPEQRISVVYEGTCEGQEKTNHEAKEFHFMTKEKIAAMPKEAFFASHGDMTARYFKGELNGLGYIGRRTPLDAARKQQILDAHQKQKEGYTSAYVNQSIAKVHTLYQSLSLQFEQWAGENLKEPFIVSRDAIKGWSKLAPEEFVENSTEEAKTWNDDKQLWQYLEIFKLAAANTSESFFKTRITTGECGGIEQVLLVEKETSSEGKKEHRYAVLKSGNVYQLPASYHLHGNNFKENAYATVLNQLDVEIDAESLEEVGLYEDARHKNEWGNFTRSFAFQVNTFEEPKAIPGNETVWMTAEDLLSLPVEAFKHDQHKTIVDETFAKLYSQV